MCSWQGFRCGELIRYTTKSFRIGVIEDNYKGKKFWSDLGYIKIKEATVNKLEKSHIVNVMTSQISI